ncbi:spore germination protein KA [Bacillus sp. OV322]|uniref:spore germination protein n=1 Tax=Bacillus sp. OV322 TaxID=1882764 RepID=UPI0008F0FF5B|nr:spore germination protein [Bacillus sp. OV322]SFC96276.1 spore germination protein KA [Bacillus sp. OV322]
MVRKIAKRSNNSSPVQKSDSSSVSMKLGPDIEKNIELIKAELGHSSDLAVRIMKNRETELTHFAVFHIEGISSAKNISMQIMEPLLKLLQRDEWPSLFDVADMLSVPILTETEDIKDLIPSLVSGNTVILLRDAPQALVASTAEVKKRAIEESTTQTVIRGPKDSFTEDNRVNTSLVRMRVKNPSLRLKALEIGTLTKTKVEYMYLDGIIEPSILQELDKRLKEIHADQVLDSSYIEKFLQDHPESIFPTMISTERPDSVAANLLEGKFAIFVEGSPFILIGPVIFSQYFQSPEDYYLSKYISSFVRILRFISFFLTLYTPALYIALISHHLGLIPTVLVISLAAQREGVPFPLIIEVIIMELAFEIMREAGVRMPRAVGNTVSIVGAIIIGQAAVEAGIVSAATVIIVSITAIASFTLPYYNMSNTGRILRFSLILAGAYIGLYGILLVTLAIAAHLCSLRSFGMPYFVPFAPARLSKQKDTLINLTVTQSPIRKEENTGGDSK